MCDSDTISRYVISYYNSKNVLINNLKLQRILYYIQGYSLKFFDVKAFKEPIYRWKYGTVVPEEYYKYCFFIKEPISYIDKQLPYIEPKLLNLIECICDKCLNITEYEITKMVLNEYPCKKSELYKIISIDSIYKYFKNNNPLKIQRRMIYEIYG